MQYTTANAIQAILFATSDEWTIGQLAKALDISADDTETGVSSLTAQLEGQGVGVARMGDTVALVTSPACTGIIANIRREELQKELSRASAETLAVIIYGGAATSGAANGAAHAVPEGVSKAQIEMIRGVNVSYSLRHLQMRGLIESFGSGRSVLYRPTIALLQSFGVTRAAELPHYEETRAKIAALLSAEPSAE